MQVKNMRKEVADLLRTNKQESARIRVEAVIRENLLLQAFEVLELFLELLAVRVQLVEKSKDVPPDMIEALSSLVYAAQRVQVLNRNSAFYKLILVMTQPACMWMTFSVFALDCVSAVQCPRQIHAFAF
jgi:hypothetical protein